MWVCTTGNSGDGQTWNFSTDPQSITRRLLERENFLVTSSLVTAMYVSKGRVLVVANTNMVGLKTFLMLYHQSHAMKQDKRLEKF